MRRNGLLFAAVATAALGAIASGAPGSATSRTTRSTIVRAHRPRMIDLPDPPSLPPVAAPAALVELRAVSDRVHAALALARGRVPEDSIDTIEWSLDRIDDALAAGRADSCRVARLPEIVAQAEGLARGEDVVAAWRGATWRAYRSPLDGTLQPYALYLPPTYDARRRYPLVVALHGMNGSAMRSLVELFGATDDDGLSDEALACRDPDVPADRDAIAIAPTGFGNTNYRLQGDADVMAVLDRVERRYAVDPERVYLTGPSMGGTGTVALGLEHPDRFAAIAALVGYPDRRLDAWVEDERPLLYPWEAFGAEVRSPVDWAANGLHLPLWTMHGLRDEPRRSLSILDAYHALGYEAHAEWWDMGHFVQYVAYRDGRIFDLFARYREPANPARVVYRTPSLRFDRAYWVRIEGEQVPGAWMEVDAAFSAPNHLVVRTANVTRVALSPRPPLVDPLFPLRVEIDGDDFEVAYDPTRPLVFGAKGGRWRGPLREPSARPAAAPVPGAKRPGLSGPIEDAFYDPLLVVYGTHDEAERATALAVATQLAQRHDARYPVLRDVDLTPEQAATHDLMLVGTPGGNSVLGAIAPALPIRIEPSGITVGGTVFTAPDTGVTLIYPNPRHPDRYVLVVSGTSAGSLRGALALPEYLPDYIVYDRRIGGERGGHVLDGRPVDCAGYFTEEWKLTDGAGAPPPAPSAWPPPEARTASGSRQTAPSLGAAR